MITRLTALVLCAVVAAPLTACAPSKSSETTGNGAVIASEPRDVVLRQLLAQQARLWNIAYPILTKGSEFCSDQVRPNFGFQAWTRWDISRQYRIASMSVYGLDDQVRVVHILPGSPAAVAGLRAGDIIEKISWHKIPTGKSASASLQRVLEKEAVVGKPLSFYLRRGGQSFVLEIVPQPQCDYALILTESDHINAFFDQRKVYVTDGLMRFIGDDSQVAAVVSHALGHALLAHVGESSAAAGLVQQLDALRTSALHEEARDDLQEAGRTPESRPFSLDQEIQADRLALELLARANYPLEAQGEVWRFLSKVRSGVVLLREFHPISPERLEAIDDLVARTPDTKTAGVFARWPSTP